MINILLVDDDELNFRLVKNYLGRFLRKLKVQYKINHIDNSKELILYLNNCIITSTYPDIILFDYNLGTTKFPDIINKIEGEFDNIFNDKIYVFTCYDGESISIGEYEYISKSDGDKLKSVVGSIVTNETLLY